MDSQDRQHQQIDEKLQNKQNTLIERNTKITIVLGLGAILAQLLEVIINILK